MSNSGLREQVLEACRGLAACGLGSGIGGHVSVRVPGKRLYWTNVLDRSFEEMQLADIVLLDFDGRVVDSDRVISPGIGFHPGIYDLRADVGAIVHTHGFWVSAQSAYARAPRTLHNLATYFYERTAVSPDDDIESIAPTLKPDDVAIVIPWHGAITIGPTVGIAAALHVTFDLISRFDVTVPMTAPEMPRDHAVAIQGLLKKADYLNLTWDLMRRKARWGAHGDHVVPMIAA